MGYLSPIPFPCALLLGFVVGGAFMALVWGLVDARHRPDVRSLAPRVPPPLRQAVPQPAPADGRPPCN